jgi:hypothetical protein
VVNVYDNSIRYTDHFLAQTIDWLKTQQSQFETGMFYMSDHGESLGELGVYLHGMPYAMAPDDQKHVPMIAWLGTLGARTGLNQACLSKTLDQPLSHDNLFHTVMGLMDVTRRPTSSLWMHLPAAAGQLALTAQHKKASRITIRPFVFRLLTALRNSASLALRAAARPARGVLFQQIEQLVHHHGHGPTTISPAKARPICMEEPAETSR